MADFIATCQNGYENYLQNELVNLKNAAVLQLENSHLIGNKMIERSVFAHYIAHKPIEINGTSVNQLAGSIFDFFYNHNKSIIFDHPWHCVFLYPSEIEGLSRRCTSIQKAFSAILKKRMARVSKLACYNTISEAGNYNGLFVFFSNFKKCYISSRFIYNGQRRMAFHPEAPSRSFLKVEEAFSILGSKPDTNDFVVDLGASPGGWSFSAALKGAQVYAIDNGRLKGGALNHPRITHYQLNAFDFKPEKRIDWLLCDMIEEPYKVLKMVEEWITRRLCRFFIVNLKFGYTDIISLIQHFENNLESVKKMTTLSKIIHLYHDRDEVTWIGIVNV